MAVSLRNNLFLIFILVCSNIWLSISEDNKKTDKKDQKPKGKSKDKDPKSVETRFFDLGGVLNQLYPNFNQGQGGVPANNFPQNPQSYPGGGNQGNYPPVNPYQNPRNQGYYPQGPGQGYPNGGNNYPMDGSQNRFPVNNQNGVNPNYPIDNSQNNLPGNNQNGFGGQGGFNPNGPNNYPNNNAQNGYPAGNQNGMVNQGQYPNGPNNYPMDGSQNRYPTNNQNGNMNYQGPNQYPDQGSMQPPNRQPWGQGQNLNQQRPIYDPGQGSSIQFPNQDNQLPANNGNNQYPENNLNQQGFNQQRPGQLPNEYGNQGPYQNQGGGQFGGTIDDFAPTNNGNGNAILGKPVRVPTTTVSPDQIYYEDGSGSSNQTQCVQDCPSTSEYNPVCGTNNVTYFNPGKFVCARNCGVTVYVARRGTCQRRPM